jgi:hypothetical protein
MRHVPPCGFLDNTENFDGMSVNFEPSPSHMSFYPFYISIHTSNIAMTIVRTKTYENIFQTTAMLHKLRNVA